MATAEDGLKPQERYMAFLLKGKCYDKVRQYNLAAAEYSKALESATE